MSFNVFIILLILLTTNKVYLALKITLYYETLCPDSQLFIAKQLMTAQNTFGDQINIELVPFGNVDEYRDAKGVLKFHCQHGVQECRANKIQSCVYNDFWWSNPGKLTSLNFFMCMFRHNMLSTFADKVGEECAKQYFPAFWKEIMECSTTDKGRDIYRLMARKTKALNPSSSYVPWVTFNGQYSQHLQSRAEKDLSSLICEIANPTPPQCNSILNSEDTYSVGYHY